MEKPIATYTGNRYELDIHYEMDPDSPREWYNLGTMVCWHGEYTLGDKHDYSSPKIFREEITEDKNLILPVYAYDHSGICLSTSSFNDPWDSGQVGYVYVSHEDIKKEFGDDDEATTKAAKILESELETYNMYLNGDVYSFVIRERCKECGHAGNVVESCGGFYGDNAKESGLLDQIDTDIENDLKADAKFRALLDGNGSIF